MALGTIYSSYPTLCATKVTSRQSSSPFWRRRVSCSKRASLVSFANNLSISTFCPLRGDLRLSSSLTSRMSKPLLHNRKLTVFASEESTTQVQDEQNGDSTLSIDFDNTIDDAATIISIQGANQENLLASVATAFNSLGLVVMDASISTERETFQILDIFTVTDSNGNKLKEEEFDNVKNFLLKTCRPSSKSAPPSIYGLAAAAEVDWLRKSVSVSSGAAAGSQGAQVASGKKADMFNAEESTAREQAAAMLELAAAEMAQAAAALVNVERSAAQLARQVAELGSEDPELVGKLETLDNTRMEASAILERRMAAMEAALASRRQYKEAAVRKSSPEVLPAPLPVFQKPLEKSQAYEIGTGPACGQGYELILQGFNWESCKGMNGACWYDHLNSRLDEFVDAGYTSIWLPPPTESVSLQGYLPLDLYNLNSKFGSEEDLKRLLGRMREKNLKSVADIVINHRCASGQKDGVWNQFGGRLAWDESAITNDNPEWKGRGNRSTGEEYGAAPNIDHTNEGVRNSLKTWLKWMREHIGFDGWRFDYVKGYSGKFTQEYVDASVPRLAFGEFWDACNYSDGVLSYNQDSHRQRTVDWCDSTGGTTAAFDFTTKGILQEAVGRKELWRLTDAQGRPPGMMGLWPSRAVTFIDNHDTGSTLNHWPFPWDLIPCGYCYLLTHPGTPCIFIDHWNNEELNKNLRDLIQVRKKLRINARSKVTICVARGDLYAAIVDENCA
mmetsp:Transcript_23952/g.32951  ORF Transcript_23952/g.32951 Transcript_23952/m.32951 type:complete len:730 (+) Transcript_23952:170-2359(+)